MTAPSLLHEERVIQLDAMAVLAGCSGRVDLDPWTVPDVVRVDHHTKRLFVGDGKASETAGCAASVERLRGYVLATLPWLQAGYRVRFAIGHAHGSGEWGAVLERLVRVLSARTVDAGTVRFDDGTTVSWLDVTRDSTT